MMDAKAAGIIFPNLHDENLPELVAKRTMASLPICGRYRMIDFCLSSMARTGMQNVSVIAARNYQSLMDHLGAGREWDLSRKRGGLAIFPPYGREGDGNYGGRLESVYSVLSHLEGLKEELVVLSDCDIAFNMDYKDLLAAHLSSGADVTVVYEKREVEPGMQRDNVVFAFNDEGYVNSIRVNEYKKGQRNVGMNVFVMGREYLISIVREGMVKGHLRLVTDFLAPHLKQVKIFGYEFTGYRARIYDMQSYFYESMRMLDAKSLHGLFPEDLPVYTKVRDEAPVRYSIGSQCIDSMVADGCIVQGEVENCMLFRGVRVGKGAKLKNCVVMQGSHIEEGAVMENVVTDKNVTVCAGQTLRGAARFPVFIAKGCIVT